MPETEGYMGIINLLTEALGLTDEGRAKELVHQARAETVKQFKQSVTSLEMGMDLGRLLREEEDRPRAEGKDPRFLSQCPFCGQTPIGCQDKDHSGEYYVFCESCRTEGPPADSVENAYVLWNGRKR